MTTEKKHCWAKKLKNRLQRTIYHQRHPLPTPWKGDYSRDGNLLMLLATRISILAPFRWSPFFTWICNTHQSSLIPLSAQWNTSEPHNTMTSNDVSNWNGPGMWPKDYMSADLDQKVAVGNHDRDQNVNEENEAKRLKEHWPWPECSTDLDQNVAEGNEAITLSECWPWLECSSDCDQNVQLTLTRM